MRHDNVPRPSDAAAPRLHSRHRDRSRLWRSRWAAIGAAVAVTLGGGAVHLAGASGSDPSNIVSITPVRILDTRDPVDLGLAGPFVSAVGQDLQVTGQIDTVAGPQVVVPEGANGVMLNVTAVEPTARGFLSVRPAGTPGPPETSSLNFEAGEISPNAVFVAIPTSGPETGMIEITYDAFGEAGPTADVLVDVVGFTVPAEHAGVAVLSAVVDLDGSLVRGTNVVSSDRWQNQVGRYQVVFDRDVTDCTFNATAGRPVANTNPAPRFAMVAHLQGEPEGVAVFVRDQDGLYADFAFHLTVHC